MKLPGPDHPITITANPKRIRVTAGGVVIADTTHTTHCPYKGDASYYSINADGKTLENSIWTYETPFPAMAEISGHLAFYPDKVKIEEVA
jgi:uncharacterized protein (DUF427 family)